MRQNNEIAMVNDEPSVFEPLKVYCNLSRPNIAPYKCKHLLATSHDTIHGSPLLQQFFNTPGIGCVTE